MNITVDSNYYARLSCASKLPGFKVIIIPSWLLFEDLPLLLIKEGISYYQTEIAILDQEEQELEERKSNLEHLLEYEPDNWTGEPLLVGPHDYLTALYSLDSLVKLRANMQVEIKKLQGTFPHEVKEFLRGFEVISESLLPNFKADSVECIIKLVKGFSLEATPEACLAARRLLEETTDHYPFIKHRKAANQRAREINQQHKEGGSNG